MRPKLKVITIVVFFLGHGAVIYATCPKTVPNEEACTSYPEDESLETCESRNASQCTDKKYIDPQDGDWGCRPCTEDDQAHNVAGCFTECLSGTTANNAVCWTETTCRNDPYNPEDCEALATENKYKAQKIWDACNGS